MVRKTVNIILIGCIILLQPRLWCGDGSIVQILRLKKTMQSQEAELNNLTKKNSQLYAQIKHTKSNPEAIEELARFKLGMIKKKETYYQVVMPIE